MRRRMTLVVAATLTAVVLVLSIVGRVVLSGSYGELEERAVREQAGRALQGVQFDLQLLDNNVKDWGVWDDAWRFMGDRDPAFIHSNINSDTFRNLGIDLFLLADPRGGVTFARFLDPATGAEAPLPPGLPGAIDPSGPLLRRALRGEGTRCLLRLGDDVWMLAAGPVVPSNRQQKVRGLLLMGIKVTDAYAESLSGRIREKISLRPPAAGEQGPVMGVVAFPDFTLLEITVAPLDDSTAVGKALLPDLAGIPCLEISVAVPRDIMARGRESVRVLSLFLLLAGLMGWLVADIFLSRVVRNLEASEAELLRRNFYDTLTGLPNRAFLLAEVGRLMESGRKPDGMGDERFALLMLDLDRFRVVNDSLGHEFGDRLLVQVGKRFSGYLGGSEMLARVGGDEFAILLRPSGASQRALQTAERLLAAMSVPFYLGKEEVYAGVSIGIANGESGKGSAEDVIRSADVALEDAKREGKSRYVVFNSDVHSPEMGRLQAETEIRRAIERGEFIVFFQPIVSFSRRVVEGFEALVRWKRPDGAILSPDKFLPLAEETGLALAIGQAVTSQACREAVRLREHHPDLFMCVNLSGRQFYQPDLIEEVLRAIHSSRLPPSALILEITEGVVMEDDPRASAILRRLKDLGVGLAMDDFGTGFSSLASLQRFPFDLVKIDRSLVMGMDAGGRAAHVMGNVVRLVTDMGMKVLAEGVETQAQAERVAETGCDLIQGFLFARPLPYEQAEGFLTRKLDWPHGESGL
jgi:diguanylate cyclase (GGDEF)-like protein